MIFAFSEQGRAEDALANEQAARATSDAALAIAERNAIQTNSLLLAGRARQLLAAEESQLALALAIEAVNIEDPPTESVRSLAAIAEASTALLDRFTLGGAVRDITVGPGQGRVLITTVHGVHVYNFEKIEMDGSDNDIDGGEVTDAEFIYFDDSPFIITGQLDAVRAFRDGSFDLFVEFPLDERDGETVNVEIEIDYNSNTAYALAAIKAGDDPDTGFATGHSWLIHFDIDSGDLISERTLDNLSFVFELNPDFENSYRRPGKRRHHHACARHI